VLPGFTDFSLVSARGLAAAVLDRRTLVMFRAGEVFDHILAQQLQQVVSEESGKSNKKGLDVPIFHQYCVAADRVADNTFVCGNDCIFLLTTSNAPPAAGPSGRIYP
jgi:hypothetical protein